MLIGVDAACLSTNNPKLQAGVYVVAKNLLIQLAKKDKKNSYILYSFAPIPLSLMNQFPKNWENKILPRIGWMSLWLPASFLQKKPDVFLALSQALPWYHPFKTIGFIHGLDFLPEFHQEENGKLKKNSEYLIRNADLLVTTSDFLSKSLQTIYNKENVIIASLGIDSSIFKKIKPYHSKIPYFLFVGTMKPSKNIPTLIKAFLQFIKKEKKKYNLLLIGSDYWTYDLHEFIRTGLQKQIIHVPAITQKDLVKYYKGATAFVSPSLYEGFGLPFLEAMTCECPVIGSTAGAIPEIVGRSGILIEPNDINGITRAMKKIVDDKKYRSSLVKKGKEKASKYTWSEFANIVYSTIEHV